MRLVPPSRRLGDTDRAGHAGPSEPALPCDPWRLWGVGASALSLRRGCLPRSVEGVVPGAVPIKACCPTAPRHGRSCIVAPGRIANSHDRVSTVTAHGLLHKLVRDAFGFRRGFNHQFVKVTQHFVSTEVRFVSKDLSYDSSSFPYHAYVVFGGCQERSIPHASPSRCWCCSVPR